MASPEEDPEAVEEFLLAQLSVQHHANTRRVQQVLSGEPVATSPNPKIAQKTAESPTTASPAKATPKAKPPNPKISSPAVAPSKRKAAKEAPAEAPAGSPVPAAAKAAAKGAASSSRNVKAKPAAAEQGDTQDSTAEPAASEQGDTHDTRGEGYDPEGAASRAEDHGEEDDMPVAKVMVTIAGAGTEGGDSPKADFVQELPSHLHPPQKLKEGAKSYTLISDSKSTKITVLVGERCFYAKPGLAYKPGLAKRQLKLLLDALDLRQDNQGGVRISVGKLGLEKSVELVTKLLEF